MAEIVTVARPYAEAVFKLAVEQKALTAWSEALQLLVTVVTHPDVVQAIDNPKSTAEALETVLLSIVGENVSPSARSFVSVLVENKRLTLLPEIAHQFEQLKLVSEHEVEAHIATAFSLKDTELAEITARLVSRFGCKVRATVSLDSALLGGVKITVGDEVIDASVQGKLQAMAFALKS